MGETFADSSFLLPCNSTTPPVPSLWFLSGEGGGREGEREGGWVGGWLACLLTCAVS